MLAKPGTERLCVHRARLPGDHFSVLEQHQGRDGLDVVASGQFRRRFGVDLEEPDIGLELGGDALIRSAATAPLATEMKQRDFR